MISGRGYQALGPLSDSSLSPRGYPSPLDEGHRLPTVRAPPIGRGHATGYLLTAFRWQS